MRLLGKRRATKAAAYYKGVPVVDLLAVESRKPMTFFGAEGPLMWVRLALISALIVGVGGYYYTNRAADRYASLQAAAIARAAAASNVVDQATSLQKEIDTLGTQGNLSQKDFAYLHGQPQALVTAVQSAISLNVAGVSVVSVETSPPDEVDVRIAASTNLAAAIWTSKISSPSVRVVSSSSVSGQALLYDVTLQSVSK